MSVKQHRYRRPGDHVDHVSRDLLHVIVRASCSLWKIIGAYYTKLDEKLYSYSLIKNLKKNTTGSQDEILEACARYLQFALVSQRCACYMRMNSFSANQKCVVLSCNLSSSLLFSPLDWQASFFLLTASP